MADEIETLEPSEPLRQGDVLVEETESPDCAALVIVTADCDLTHGKFGTHLTALPVITLEDYLRDFWFSREFRRFRRRLVEGIVNEMLELYALGGLDDRLPSEERLVDWPLEAGADQVGQQLGVQPEAVEELRQLVETTRQLDAVVSSAQLEERAAMWCCVAVQVGEARNPTRAQTALVKRLTNEVPGQLPGDVLYLNQVVPGDDRGFVALARFPRPVEPDRISRSDADFYFNQAGYRRVARLASPFRYRLTQLFGEVYSAIGLPRTYEDNRGARFAALATTLARTLNEEVDVD